MEKVNLGLVLICMHFDIHDMKQESHLLLNLLHRLSSLGLDVNRLGPIPCSQIHDSTQD
jgi:hypothetical protein